MPERDPDEAYSIILEALRAHGLSWVATQIQDQVRSGKPTTRVVSPRPAPISGLFAEEVSQPRGSRRERLAATEPYSSQERLALALDALERAVVHTADMEEEVAKFFATERTALRRVAFEPEQFDDSRALELQPLETSRRAGLVRLLQALAALRDGLSSDARH